MSMQQILQPRPASNGTGRRKVERDLGVRLDNKLPPGKSNPGSFSNADSVTGSKVGGYESHSHDRLIYMTTCLIGHPVEVQVKNGSTYSGIFHATNAEKEFGIVLKMARLTKDCSLKSQKLASDSVGKGLSKTMIIPAKELVQVIAKLAPSFGGPQPIVYNPTGSQMQPPQPYIHPNGPYVWAADVSWPP